MPRLTTHPLVAGINHLQANYLDGTMPTFTQEAGLADGFSLLQINGLRRFWDEGSNGFGALENRQEEFLTSLYSGSIPWAFIVIGDAKGLLFYYALPGGDKATRHWISALQACFPGVDVEVGQGVSPILEHFRTLPHVATLTGNPSADPVVAPGAPGYTPHTPRARLESVIRSMKGRPWAYFVLGKAVPPPAVESAIRTLAAEERETVSKYLRPGTVEANNNPLASRYLGLVRSSREKHELGQLTGMWDVQVYLLAHHPQDLARGIQALTGAYAGSSSQPQPLRVRRCVRAGLSAGAILPRTRLTTPEAALLARLPGEEFPGYHLREFVRFAVSPAPVRQQERIAVGTILNEGQRTPNWFEVGLDDLSKHVFVAGFTGSGKTCTCQYLLSQLWEEHHIPWLALEPASKTEYRRMLAASFSNDVRVFTLGDETGVPFRINPLEITPGVHAQTHIDGLSALFNTAFALVTPMPNVLNLALHRVYSDFGWDLLQGTHPNGHGPENQPTLSDLIDTIQRLVSTLGYGAEVRGNIQAGLQTRLMGLTVGGKGAMLDSGVSVPMDYLLAKPTVIELSAIGDDDEKAFVVAALLLKLAEYRRIQGLTSGNLRHVTLLEEAHRLLRAVPETMSSEIANPRGKAVEVFCQMLTEMRAYGEGAIIVDQIPAKLAPDAVKSTNLKIVHRLVAEDDRRLVGTSMNLTSAQQKSLATLQNGECVAYAEGRETAYMLSVPNHGERHGLTTSNPSKADLIRHMRGKLPQAATNPCRRQRTPRVTSDLPRCPGCEQGACPSVRDRLKRKDIVDFLLRTDQSEALENAFTGGWRSLWTFGERVAHRIWGDRTPNDAPFCILMNIAALAGYEPEQVDKMRRNLTVLSHRTMEERR